MLEVKMANTKVLQREIRKLEDQRREIRQKIGELHEREEGLNEEIQKLRVEGFLQEAPLHFQLVEWEPISVSSTFVCLNAVGIEDNVDHDIHAALALGYHDEEELEEGVTMRVDDEVMRLLIDDPSTLLDFASRYHLNIRWKKFHEMLEDVAMKTSQSADLESQLRQIIKDLKIPEDAK
jgi:hypothetical protein